ncbi:hypothetical protein DICVIV_10511 [Dictyocaulus viviparus]|uniref:POLQ-like helical domain-containing protein n=1 Tax=Dictyocaulus viviparus TaxID=29172 RepID=A0A0D8XIA7_DICVI|nr:hypothetical protein DICVIV_10511 [Dictyocaulus viviparus]
MDLKASAYRIHLKSIIDLLALCICNGMTKTNEELEATVQFTLFKQQKTVQDMLSYLKSNRFVTVENQNGALSVLPTQLGRAALVSALPPDAALFVFADLQQATRAVALDTELHMLYLVTPSNCSIWQGCDWNHLHNIFIKLLPAEKRVAKLLHLRFFSALALFDIINEKSIDEVASHFKISRGTLQTLQQQSATYATMVVAFCSRLGWTYLRDLLHGFAIRLAFGVRKELTELVSIDGIDASRNNSSDGFNEWLFGESKMRLIDAATILRQRAIRAVEEHLRYGNVYI